MKTNTECESSDSGGKIGATQAILLPRSDVSASFQDHDHVKIRIKVGLVETAHKKELSHYLS